MEEEPGEVCVQALAILWLVRGLQCSGMEYSFRLLVICFFSTVTDEPILGQSSYCSESVFVQVMCPLS